MASAHPKLQSFRQAALGLFVVVQLAFLVVANGLNIVGSPHLGLVDDPGALRLARLPTQVWANATYQFQGWTQYAPHVPHGTAFPSVVLNWPGRPPVKLLSRIEPADPNHFFRPLFQFRLEVYESWLISAYWAWDRESATGQADAWRKHLRANFSAMRYRYRDYILWRAAGFVDSHPGTPPPREIVCSARVYRISPPGERPWHWDGPDEVPVTRWRFDGNWNTDDAPDEWFDPFAGRFVSLSQGDET